MENYFFYRWINFKNRAFREEDGMLIIENSQLPDELQYDIFQNFLFKDISKVFFKNFSFPILQAPHKHSFFTSTIHVYNQFMTDLLKNMEPRYVDP